MNPPKIINPPLGRTRFLKMIGVKVGTPRDAQRRQETPRDDGETDRARTCGTADCGRSLIDPVSAASVHPAHPGRHPSAAPSLPEVGLADLSTYLSLYFYLSLVSTCSLPIYPYPPVPLCHPHLWPALCPAPRPWGRGAATGFLT